MSKIEYKKILYLLSVTITIVLLLVLLNHLQEQYLQEFDFKAVERVITIVLFLVGVVIGSHNIIRNIAKSGTWQIDYYVLILFLVVFFFANILQYVVFSTFIIKMYVRWRGVPMLWYTSKIVSGYLVTMIAVKESSL